MTTSTTTPRSVTELAKVTARLGKRAVLFSGVDPASERLPSGKVAVDISQISALLEFSSARNKVVIGTGVNLGRLARETVGENGLIRQAALLIANPLVRNRITLLQALDPDSPYFDISTPLALLDSKVRLQTPTSKRTISIKEFLEASVKGLKKGEIPVAIEFSQLPSSDLVGFFRVARMGGKGSVSAAARMKLVKSTCVDPEIFVSSLTLIPMRSKTAEKEVGAKPASEASIKRASQAAASELVELAEKRNAYERTLIEITVARTLRSIMEDSIQGI
ncbi:MAG TPA: FAD binding domain-containing protein [Terriglobia bacterium]|nr:FAD binding domain-containing protein [Terriglobia bacterium]